MSKNAKIGIDLGTTYCSAGILKKDSIDMVLFNNNSRSIPSHVYFNPESDEIVVGDAAKYNSKSVGQSVYDSKRFIGKEYYDKSVQENIDNWTFNIVKSGLIPKVEIQYNNELRSFTAEDISSLILKEIKKSADQYLGKDINTTTDAVVTVPAYFDNHQRECTMKAAEDAGLNVIQILNEPTAAAIAYSYQRISINKSNPSKRTILIYDFGGGTFDVSIIRLDEYKKEVSVLTSDGDSHLGGEDIDNLLVDYFLERYKDSTGSKIITDKKKIALRKECEKAKELLSSSEEAYIDCDFLEDVDVDCNITISEYNNLILPLLKRTIDVVEKILKNSKINKDEIDDILCVGGSSRIPKIYDLIKEYFPGKNICQDINANEVVAQGATIVANMNEFNFEVKDVVSHSLSTDIEDDLVYVMIPKNTTIPCQHTEKFGNAEDNQTYIDVNVFEGENKRTNGNKLLGSFRFDNITPSPARTVIIQVTFMIDKNGILTVSGEESRNGIKKNLTINLR